MLSPVFDVAAPKIPNNYGATLELQRIEEEDRLEQAILMANMQHHRRQNNGQVRVKVFSFLVSLLTGLVIDVTHLMSVMKFEKRKIPALLLP